MQEGADKKFLCWFCMEGSHGWKGHVNRQHALALALSLTTKQATILYFLFLHKDHITSPQLHVLPLLKSNNQNQNHGSHLISLKSWLWAPQRGHWNAFWERSGPLKQKPERKNRKASGRYFLVSVFRWEQWDPEWQGHEWHGLPLELWAQSPTNTLCVLSSCEIRRVVWI